MNKLDYSWLIPGGHRRDEIVIVWALIKVIFLFHTQNQVKPNFEITLYHLFLTYVSHLLKGNHNTIISST